MLTSEIVVQFWPVSERDVKKNRRQRQINSLCGIKTARFVVLHSFWY